MRLGAPLAREAALRLTDDVRDIYQSNYVRRPWIEGYKSGQKVNIDYWYDLELSGGGLVQWLYLNPSQEIDEIVIRAKSVPHLDKFWVIEKMDICQYPRSNPSER